MFRDAPRARSLFVVAAFLLAVPLVALAMAEYQRASDRVEGAREAEAIVDRLNVMLRLAPALSIEQNTSAAILGAGLLPDDVPPFVLASTGIDFDRDLIDARLAVDEALRAFDGAELRRQLEDVRSGVDESESVSVVVERYSQIQRSLTESINAEASRLLVATGDAGSADELIAAIDVAEAAARLQIVVSGQETLWAQLSVPFANPTTAQVISLAQSIALAEETSRDLARRLDQSSPVRPVWTAWNESDVVMEYRDVLRRTSEHWVTDGSGQMSSGGDDPVVEFAELDIPALTAQLKEVGDVVAISEVVSSSLSEIVETALGTAREATAGVLSEAHDAQRKVISWIVVFSGLVGIVGIVASRILIRPAGRLAEATAALRDGRLDIEVPIAGPIELRTAARAMNEAIASLRLAEGQALALAEERLDDPILDQTAPGTLGNSLQSAVDRLTSGLSEREELQKRVAHDAAHDGLTKLPNRSATLRHLDAALARADRSSTMIALLFIDVDGFKSINDTHGHPVGDAVLRAIANRLVNSIRDGDVAGRLGGDEFLVVAEPVETIDDALNLTHRISAALCEPVMVAGANLSLSVSIGIGLSGSGDLSADELLRDADLAVYRAKELGRGQVHVCSEELRTQIVERESMEHAIRAAIDNDDFTLHFQPAIDSRRREVTSLEALVRWNREGSLVAPAEFIPVAERTELIVELDRWVLNACATQLAAWTDHELLSSIPVAVNISGRHISAGTLVDDVTTALNAHSIEPTRLIVELTETALLEDLDRAARDLTALRHLGIRVALDDFGTGYMSLSTLRNLPVDVLKIDQTFVSNLEASTEHSLIELIVNTGHLLGMNVTAEGVETAEQYEQLTALGSDNLQGFLFSKPVEVADLEQLLVDNARSEVGAAR